MQSQESDLKTQLSSFGKIQSLASDLNDAASALASTTLWTQTVATSSDSTYVGASSADGAASGNYSVTVDHLATGQTVTSAALPKSSSTLSTGTLSIQLGSYTGSPESAFVPKTDANGNALAAVSVTIGPSDTSLASIRDKINAANAGVTASIVNDASGARLSIRSNDTGLENGFRITATEDTDDGDPTKGLSMLGFDALSSSQMTRNQKAVNAQATINGIDISSASNTLDNVADGLTLTLVKPTTNGPINVSVGSDTASIQSDITNFVKAFNAMASYIHDQTKYDSGSKTGGPLQGNSSAVGLQNQLRAILNQASSASSKFTTLSDIGIVMKEDGTLETKSSKMSDALNNLTELRKVFSTDSGSSASSGFMVRYRDYTSRILDPGGSLTAANDSLNNRIKDLDKRMDAMNTSLSATEARLRAQYQALDTQMSTMTGLSSYMNAQLAALSKTA
jgi:flagellar hook-associated protein 2